LDWQQEKKKWSADYDLCLVDGESLPNLPPDPDLLALLNQWQRDLNEMPFILITNNRDWGQWAVEAKIDDYWLLSALTVDMTERSLRLLTRWGQTVPRQGLPLTLGGLKTSSAYYRSLVEHHPYALLGLDKCARLIVANLAARQLLNLGEDYLGQALADIDEGQLADKWIRDHDWILRTGKSLEQIENFSDPANQRLMVFSTVKRPLFSPSGQILGIQILLWEVTKEQQFQDRLNLLQTLLLEIDQQSDFTTALTIILQRICNTTGWQYGEVWLPQLDDDYPSSVLKISKAWYCNAPELVRYYEESKNFIFLPGEGLPGRVWVSGQPEWIEDVTQADAIHYFMRRELAKTLELKGALGVPIQMNGKVIAVMVFFTRYFWVDDPSLIDMVTAIAEQLGLVLARKQNEERQAEQLQLIINALPVCIAYLNPKLRYQFVNQTYEAWFHKSPQEIVGQSIEFVLGSDLFQEVLPTLHQACQGNVTSYQIIINPPGCKQRTITTTFIPDLDTQGQLQGVFLMAIEVGVDGTPQLSF
jgi:PAS domain-containing protein